MSKAKKKTKRIRKPKPSGENAPRPRPSLSDARRLMVACVRESQGPKEVKDLQIAAVHQGWRLISETLGAIELAHLRAIQGEVTL